MAKNMLSLSDKIKSARWAFDCVAWKPVHSELALASSCIQEEEKERINKYVFQKDVKRSLIGRLLIRKFVFESQNIPWKEIKLGRDENGKPYFIEGLPSLVQFNISHSGRFVVLAGEVGDVKLGIDVMKMEYLGGKSIAEFFRIMTRHFSSDEWVSIKSYSPIEEEQIKMFYRHWCLKESYVKATGTGITVDLQKISFRIHSRKLNSDNFVEDTELFLNGKLQSNWLFQEILLSNDHCAVVALQGQNVSQFKGSCDRFSFINFPELSQNFEDIFERDYNFCSAFFLKDSVPE